MPVVRRFPEIPARGSTRLEGSRIEEGLPFQVYTTRVYVNDVEPAEFATIPDAALKLEPSPWESVDDFVRRLGLSPEGDRFYPTDLPAKLWYCLTGRQPPTGDRASWPAEDRWSLLYCEYLAYAPIIPFETSPLDKKSLGGLMASGSAVGVALGSALAGAKVGVVGGIVVSSAGGPLVVVGAAGGFIIGGAVGAVTGVLGSHILKLAPK